MFKDNVIQPTANRPTVAEKPTIVKRFTPPQKAARKRKYDFDKLKPGQALNLTSNDPRVKASAMCCARKWAKDNNPSAKFKPYTKNGIDYIYREV